MTSQKPPSIGSFAKTTVGQKAVSAAVSGIRKQKMPDIDVKEFLPLGIDLIQFYSWLASNPTTSRAIGRDMNWFRGEVNRSRQLARLPPLKARRILDLQLLTPTQFSRLAGVPPSSRTRLARSLLSRGRNPRRRTP